MRIKVWCNSGANIHSKRTEEIDTLADWNISDEEWNAMTDEQKEDMVQEWAWNSGMEIGWEEPE